MDKVNAVLAKMDGLKSIVGLLGVVGYYAAVGYGAHPPEALLKVSAGLLTVGLVHKLDKATDIIKNVLPPLAAVLELFDKKKAEEIK